MTGNKNKTSGVRIRGKRFFLGPPDAVAGRLIESTGVCSERIACVALVICGLFRCAKSV